MDPRADLVGSAMSLEPESIPMLRVANSRLTPKQFMERFQQRPETRIELSWMNAGTLEQASASQKVLRWADEYRALGGKKELFLVISATYFTGWDAYCVPSRGDSLGGRGYTLEKSTSLRHSDIVTVPL